MLTNRFHTTKLYLFTLLLLFVVKPSLAQRKKRNQDKNTQVYPQETYTSLEYRSIGPHRGGRSAAVTGVPGKPDLYYFGATGGCVWKT